MSATQYVPGWIELAGAHNVRDVGGLPAAGGVVRSGVLLRGDNLDSLTAADVTLLRDEVGLRGVVDLRAPFESPQAAEWFGPAGVTWLHEPLVDFTGLSDRTKLRDEIGGDYAKLYALMLRSAGPGLVRILDFLVSGGRTPALLHCAAGKDRTGIATSVLLALAGVERDAIVADYLVTGERIEAVRRALVQREAYSHLRDRDPSDSDSDSGGGLAFAIDERAIVSVLDTVESAPGGVAGFMIANGATADQVSRWREALVDPN
nr:tyrosine-protein phosphatase [Micromonospora sp. DSM 115978]